MTTISLITVCYNSASTLIQTLSSVADQTLLPIEHIVVDGGSKDETRDILAKWGRHTLRWYSEPDRGIYDAMNKGLSKATGDVIGFLNADDVFADKHVLAKIATAFRSSCVEATFGDLVYVARNDPSRIIRYWNSSRFNLSSFAYGAMPPHPTLYIRRHCLDQFGHFRLDLPMANDFEFCVRFLAIHRISCLYIPKVLVRMRLGGESNRSWRNVILQNRCIHRALAINHILPNPLYPLAKLLDKARQFLVRPTN